MSGMRERRGGSQWIKKMRRESVVVILKKSFNVNGICYPDQHYMVDIGPKLAEIKELIDGGKYFVINRARQYGKTTTLNLLVRYLADQYTVFFISFEGLGGSAFQDEASFCGTVCRLLSDAAGYGEVPGLSPEAEETIAEAVGKKAAKDMLSLSAILSDVCRNSERPVVLIIDEVDQASGEKVFLDFLGMLRSKYLKRVTRPAFQSVILAGVYDIKNLKQKIREEKEHQYNSPWNIAADFNVDMSFTRKEIAGMLKEYSEDTGIVFDIDVTASAIYGYTSGYPYLVSKICRMIDEKKEKDSGRCGWSAGGVADAVKDLLKEPNPLFDDMRKKISDDPELRKILYAILFRGESYPYNPDNYAIDVGTMFGFIKEENGQAVIANRIFETRLYNLFLFGKKTMITVEGKSVFGGIAIGKLLFYKKNERMIRRSRVENPDAEWSRFLKAKDQAVSELKALSAKALSEPGEENAMIFEVHQMMLEDPDYLGAVENMIRTQSVNAEFALAAASDQFARIFSSMEDAYMQGRAADVKDISERILDLLCGASEKLPELTEPCIIAADDLAPSETVQLDKSKVLGFVTRYGSPASHTAILARTMNIPAVIGVGEKLQNSFDGKWAVLDGSAGTLFVDPDEKTMEEMAEKCEKLKEQKALLDQLRGKENVTGSGRKIDVYANIGSLADLGAVFQNDAGGIGLFRSEFLYLEREDFPTEEQQFEVYKQAAESLGGKKVIIRTLDIGADKQADYFGLEKEENPAMGLRAIRICLTRPEIFKTQLRALYRAAAFGNLSIMFPMIISVDEVRKIKEVIREVKEELRSEGIPFREDVELGIMIETPAAVMVSRQLAKEVDFFSVGTNDLTQYTLAVDRQNPRLDAFYDPHHPAVLEMIRIAAESAHAEGKWIGICGELGADPELTETFLEMGIDELSVAPGMILPLRKKIRECG